MEHFSYPKIGSRAVGETTPAGTWVATEKIHGAQLTIGCNETGVRIGKRKAWLAPEEPFFGWQLLRFDLETGAQQIRAALGVSEIRLFGELFGGAYPHPAVAPRPGASAVQTGVWYAPDLRFAVFDLIVGDTFLAHRDVERLATRVGFLIVPLLGRGPRADLESLPVQFPSRVPAILGLPPIANNFAEGFVLKPDTAMPLDARPIVKRKIPAFDEARFDESAPWDPMARIDASALAAWAERLVNQARLASARSKVGEDRQAVLDEVILDVMIDLEAAFPHAMRQLDESAEEQLRTQARAAAIRLL